MLGSASRQRARHGVGLALDDGEKNAAGADGTATSLLPIPQGGQRNAKARREGALRQAKLLPDGTGIDVAWHVDGFRINATGGTGHRYSASYLFETLPAHLLTCFHAPARRQPFVDTQ